MMPVQSTAPCSPSAMDVAAGAPIKTGTARQRTPNFQLRAWRDNAQMTRSELADAINNTPTGIARHFYCDEERIRRWESGEVSWPSADYRKALREVTGHNPNNLGFRPRHHMITGLRELRTARGWSQSQALRALHDSATPEEKKALPDTDALLRNWKRWEAGEVQPDGGRADPFYKPIIARMFGVTPDTIWPGEQVTQSRVPRFVQPVAYRDEMESRRQVVCDAIGKLESELAYLNAVLAIPVPAECR